MDLKTDTKPICSPPAHSGGSQASEFQALLSHCCFATELCKVETRPKVPPSCRVASFCRQCHCLGALLAAHRHEYAASSSPLHEMVLTATKQVHMRDTLRAMEPSAVDSMQTRCILAERQEVYGRLSPLDLSELVLLVLQLSAGDHGHYMSIQLEANLPLHQV